MSKRLLIVMLTLLMVSLLGFGSLAFAQGRYAKKSSGPIEAHTSAVLPAETWVYGIKLYASSANAWMALYDTATVAAADNSDRDATALRKDEIGEATQYDSEESHDPTIYPLYFANGVTVKISNGVGFVFYGPEPE